MTEVASRSELREKITRKALESRRTQERFFEEEADRIADCASDIARAFDRGGRLWAMGNGGSACDAQHVAVEFLHPIIEKRPGLPASTLTSESAVLTAISNDEDFALVFSRQLRLVGRKGDVALGISTSGKSSNVTRGLRSAREMEMLTVGFTGRDGGRMPELCDHCFVVPSFSIHRIQEAQEVLLHILWDLVHVIRGEEDVL